jgi:hypothetical protein
MHASTASQRRDVFDEIRISNDVAWLEKLAIEPGAAEAATPQGFSPKSVRAQAYIRLGAVESAGSIGAIQRIEAAARGWSLVRPVVSLADNPHPASHFSDYHPKPLAQVTSSDGLTFALVELRRLGGVDAFLITSRTPVDPATWSRPLLVPNRSRFGVTNAQLTVSDGGKLELDFDIPDANSTTAALRSLFPISPTERRPEGRQSWVILLAEVMRDTDGDGWTDLEERRLRLNPQNRDTDGDGIPDGKDVCPGYAASPLETGDTEATIIQKVFFAGYGIHGSPNLLMVAGGSRPVQLWGARAPVLYGADRSQWNQDFGDAPPILGWRLKSITSEGGFQTAIVEFSDYEAPLAAASYRATLRRIGDEWVVVQLQMTSIS